ncbi:ATP-binding protein [Methylobacter sp.]|uniref:ATP-binding protein n=1 Tax=Methylobacter sp. TaxID=2051955 RepID=UPI002487C4B5|nr:ATP-binding protein [Methylobacter sp.]MDI1277724.1 ATP-binding protein [Methylobacter sp.]MDI1358374.1 ATP-binding protein [Methylobacter sp.]
MTKLEKSSEGVYFLSLSLENVRCFGTEQKLDLSDSNGRPAPWTVILGDNGTGKTTLLDALAVSIYHYPFQEDGLRRVNSSDSKIEVCLAYNDTLENRQDNFQTHGLKWPPKSGQ